MASAPPKDTATPSPMSREAALAERKSRFARAASLREWQGTLHRLAREARDSRNSLHADRVADFLALAKERPPADIPDRLWPAIAVRAAASGDVEALLLAGRNCDIPALRLRDQLLTTGEHSDGKKLLGVDLLRYMAAEQPSNEGALRRAAFLPSVLAALVTLGCDTRSKDADGRTLLHQLAFRPGAASVLIPHSDLDSPDSAGRTVLMRAACRHNSPAGLVQNLLAAGANPNLADAVGATALMLAAKSSAFSWAELIPVSNLALVDNHGLTAVDWALKAKNWQALDAFCMAVGAPEAEEIGRRVLRALLPQSRPRLEAASEARALREHLGRGESASAPPKSPSTRAGEASAAPGAAGDQLGKPRGPRRM